MEQLEVWKKFICSRVGVPPSPPPPPHHTLSPWSSSPPSTWPSGDLGISGDLWWSLVIQVSASSTPALSQSWGDEEKIEPTCRQEIALFPTLVDCWWWESGEARPHHQPRHPPPSLKGGARPWTSTVTKDPNLDWIALVAVTTILIQIPLLIYHPRVQQIFVKTK